MEAKELRMDNAIRLVSDFKTMYRHDFEKRRIQIIHTINADGLGCKINGYDISCFEPIPLTDEVILKCGFTHDYGHCYFMKYDDTEDEDSLDYIQAHADNKWWYFIHDPIKNNDTLIAIIENLHQLQNLYFAVSGEELEIKL